ncbi:hypothetical protein OG339_41020 [Streptosporangium sp. NBC_01495]|uniref:hypothetical protein n=1 Tax=Streptosporangium sp. NBC_01495 TaxID=2903899 RepID=UPI002E314A41|nr:hypothetical protein [Streptosporangium sp. NBC_01495]
MRRHLTAFAAIALAGGMLLTPGTANAAAPRITAPQGAANQPLAPLRTTVFYPRRAWAGDSYVYTLKIKNVGRWYTDIAYVGGHLPSQVSRIRITGKPPGSYCEVSGREVGCLLDTLNPGRTATLKVRVWLKNGARGTATANFGSVSIDVPAGGLETLDIHGIDIGTDVKYVRVKTQVLR